MALALLAGLAYYVTVSDPGFGEAVLKLDQLESRHISKPERERGE